LIEPLQGKHEDLLQEEVLLGQSLHDALVLQVHGEPENQEELFVELQRAQIPLLQTDLTPIVFREIKRE